MVIWLQLRWWYAAGWQWAFKRAIVQRLQWCNETFSITPLLKTLFAPFKQTQTKGSGSFDGFFRALIDNTVSRLVGFFARGCIILAGVISALFIIVTGIAFLILWPLIPLALPIAIVLMATGAGV